MLKLSWASSSWGIWEMSAVTVLALKIWSIIFHGAPVSLLWSPGHLGTQVEETKKQKKWLIKQLVESGEGWVFWCPGMLKKIIRENLLTGRRRRIKISTGGPRKSRKEREPETVVSVIGYHYLAPESMFDIELLICCPKPAPPTILPGLRKGGSSILPLVQAKTLAHPWFSNSTPHLLMNSTTSCVQHSSRIWPLLPISMLQVQPASPSCGHGHALLTGALLLPGLVLPSSQRNPLKM